MTARRPATRSSRCSQKIARARSTRSPRALHELRLSIALSKINTEGTKVADVFYVNELDGSKVAPGERFKEIRDGVVHAIGEG